MTDGVLVGCDQTQEWMLKWWWQNYARFNSLPVSFIDFGMSQSAKLWCKSKGSIVTFPLQNEYFNYKEQVNSSLRTTWEGSYYGNIWISRKIWLLKPFGLKETPYKRSIWTDIDCETHGNISHLLEYCNNECGFGIVQEPQRSQNNSRHRGILKSNETGYNSGVIVFKQNSCVIDKWTENTLLSHKEFLGDQDVLNRTIYLEKFEICEMPNIYNWRPADGENKNAVITHYVCERGKQAIFNKIMQSNEL